MDANLILMFICWLFLIFAIPGALIAIFMELRQPITCSPLVVMLLVITGVMTMAFFEFSKIFFPVIRAFFL